MAMQNPRHPATAADIISILGPVEDALLLEIIETGATAAEVLEAFTWSNADDQIGTELERGPRGAVMRVYEILKRDTPEEGEAR
jgi:hypothetical protein